MKGLWCSFTAEGLNLERFAAKAAEQGIHLKELKRQNRKMKGIVRESDISMLADIAAQGGWGFAGGTRQGVGQIIDWLRHRWLLAAAAILVFAAFLACTKIGWRIQIIDGGTYEADIRQALSEMQVRLPAVRSRIDPGQIRDMLEWRYPRVAWVECGWRGMTLVIRVVEGMLPAENRSSGACDVVASRAGIVESIVTCAGTPVVEIGDLVQKGQLLIKGEERTSEGMTRPVAARGNIMARVWESASVKTSLYGTQTVYSGQTQVTQTVRCPWFDLWPMQESDYAVQDISVKETTLSSFFFPCILHTETRMEAEYIRERMDLESLREENARAARQKLIQKAGGSDSLVDNWINWSIIDDEILLSVAVGERIIDIAQQIRSSGMAAPE